MRDIVSLLQLILLLVRHRPELVIYSTPKMALLGCLACRILRKPGIYIHRGAVYQNYSGLRFKIFKEIDKYIIKNSNKIYFISKSLFYWVRSAIKCDRLATYSREYNSAQGIDLVKFNIERSRSIRRARVDSPLVVGYLGRLCVDKGINVFFEVARSLPGVRFLVKGNADPDYPMPERVSKLKNLVLEPWGDDVREFFESVDILLFPSVREGFGNVCMEAAACGVLTIGRRIPGVTDSVLDGQTGWLIDAGTDFQRTACEIIRHYDKNVGLAAAMRAIDVAVERFDSSKVLGDFDTLIAECMQLRDKDRQV